MTQFFLSRILFDFKNEEVCKKKLELNTLRFDRDMKVLSLKKKHFQKILFIPTANERDRKSLSVQDFFDVFPFMSVIAPFFYMCNVCQH